MVCFALNHLWMESQSGFETGCCPHCCGPCDLLRRLHEAGTLDAIVMLAETFHWRDNAWWVRGGVDQHWLETSWDCQAQPRCEHDKDEK